jgi:hypothetical protein
METKNEKPHYIVETGHGQFQVPDREEAWIVCAARDGFTVREAYPTPREFGYRFRRFEDDPWTDWPTLRAVLEEGNRQRHRKKPKPPKVPKPLTFDDDMVTAWMREQPEFQFSDMRVHFRLLGYSVAGMRRLLERLLRQKQIAIDIRTRTYRWRRGAQWLKPLEK